MEPTDDLDNGLDSFRKRCSSFDSSCFEGEDTVLLRQRTPSFSEPANFTMCAEDFDNFPSHLAKDCGGYDGGTGHTCSTRPLPPLPSLDLPVLVDSEAPKFTWSPIQKPQNS